MQKELSSAQAIKKKYIYCVKNLQDAVNTVVKREIVVINTFSEKQKRSQVNSLT